MNRDPMSHMNMLRDVCGERRETVRPSEKADRGRSSLVPEFVRKAVAEGYSADAAAALYRKIAQTRADIRARRITPAGGMRRVERLALVVAVVGGGS